MINSKTIYSLINNVRLLNEKKTAICFKEKKISYDEFVCMVNYIYELICDRKLSNKAILIAMDRSPEMLATMLAVVESGNFYVPIDFMYPRERIEYIKRHSKTELVIVDEEHKDWFEDVDILVLPKTTMKESRKTDIEKQKNNIAYCLYTSGSTGKPKGVLIGENSLVNFIKGIEKVIPFKKCKSILCATTQCFDIFFLESIAALALGVTVYLTETEDNKNPKRLIKMLKEYDIDMIQMTPSRVTLIKEYDAEFKAFSNVKVIMIGGEAFKETLLAELQSTTTAKIYNMYGPTETTIWSSIADLTHARNINVGRPILNTTFYVVDENGIELKNGEIGELYIAGKGLSLGYLDDGVKTKENFFEFNGERVYKTGDSALYDAENDEYKVVGRLDNQIKLNGYRIELEEIENVGAKINEIKQCVVHPIKECGIVQKLVLYYTSNKELSKDKIIKTMSMFLPPYMIPKEYIKVENFEYTPNGKIDRNKIEYCYVGQTELKDEEGETEWNNIRRLLYEVTGKVISQTGEEKLSEIVDSLQFVKIIVAIETYYDFEVDDAYLNMSRYKDAYEFYVEMRKSFLSSK